MNAAASGTQLQLWGNRVFCVLLIEKQGYAKKSLSYIYQLLLRDKPATSSKAGIHLIFIET